MSIQKAHIKNQIPLLLKKKKHTSNISKSIPFRTHSLYFTLVFFYIRIIFSSANTISKSRLHSNSYGRSYSCSVFEHDSQNLISTLVYFQDNISTVSSAPHKKYVAIIFQKQYHFLPFATSFVHYTRSVGCRHNFDSLFQTNQLMKRQYRLLFKLHLF